MGPHMLSSLCDAVLSSAQHFFGSRLLTNARFASRQPQSLYPDRWLFTKTIGPYACISHTFEQRFASCLGIRVALNQVRLPLAASTNILHLISRLSRVWCLVLCLASYHSNNDQSVLPTPQPNRFLIFAQLKSSTPVNIAPAVENHPYIEIHKLLAERSIIHILRQSN